MLFLLPIIYSYILLPYSDVMFGSIICLITSVLHHYYKAQNKLFKMMDKIAVNSIAAYFTIHCIVKFGNKLYAKIMYVFAAGALCAYFIIHFYKPELYCDYHCIVHILAITGILFYIKARKTYLIPIIDDNIIIKETLSNIT